MSSVLSQNARLEVIKVRETEALGLVTGLDPESVEGLRAIKASRGEGWVFFNGHLLPWETKGIVQKEGRLVIWGRFPAELSSPPVSGGSSPWESSGADRWDLVRGFTACWAALETRKALPERFCAYSLVPWKSDRGWAFAVVPPELAQVLATLDPLAERHPWESYRHPEAQGAASWAFTGAALLLSAFQADLPWDQEDEALLHQEIRSLKKDTDTVLLPPQLDAASASLWKQALAANPSAQTGAAWSTWFGKNSWEALNQPLPPAQAQAQEQLRQREDAKRKRQRERSQFWRRRGGVILGTGIAAAVLLVLGGGLVWDKVKPDPTDQWTPEQVVKGFYQELNDLADQDLRKLITPQLADKQPLKGDLDTTTNLYVLRQVRLAYERTSPVLDVSEWLKNGRPALTVGQMLYGLANLKLERTGNETWSVSYQKWISEVENSDPKQAPLPPTASGSSVVDELGLVKTERGWKIASLSRKSLPLP